MCTTCHLLCKKGEQYTHIFGDIKKQRKNKPKLNKAITVRGNKQRGGGAGMKARPLWTDLAGSCWRWFSEHSMPGGRVGGPCQECAGASCSWLVLAWILNTQEAWELVVKRLETVYWMQSRCSSLRTGSGPGSGQGIRTFYWGVCPPFSDHHSGLISVFGFYRFWRVYKGCVSLSQKVHYL